jgi:hypothetical protein
MERGSTIAPPFAEYRKWLEALKSVKSRAHDVAQRAMS